MKGWCSKHYQRWRKTGDPEGVIQRQTARPESSKQKMRDHWANPNFRAMMIAMKEEGRELAAEVQRKKWEDPAYRQQQIDARYYKLSDSYLTKDGYRMLRYQRHPLARHGELMEHRKILYDKIGPGPHECHWNSVRGCGKVNLEWGGHGGIHADHLDDDRINNSPENLVPSCKKCNGDRGKGVV